MAFAGGKVLLFGEHAVVHGEAAIGAGLDRGVVATCTEGSEARLRVAAWDLDVRPNDGSRVGEAFGALLTALPAVARRGLFEVKPDLPAGAGLGSSAALAVAVARASIEPTDLDPDDQCVADAALASERVFHGTPSGLDHAVAIHGGLLVYRRGPPSRIEILASPAPLSLVIAPIEPGADTGAMVLAVTERGERYRDVGLFAAIGRVVREATTRLVANDLRALGELMDVNHGLLVALGASSPGLDAACHRARRAGALGAKLTGAGGGGSIVALVTPETAAAVVAALGGGAFATAVGGRADG